MKLGKKVLCTLLAVALMGYWTRESIKMYGLFSGVSAYCIVMAVLLLAMVWIPEHNWLDVWLTKMLKNEDAEEHDGSGEQP